MALQLFTLMLCRWLQYNSNYFLFDYKLTPSGLHELLNVRFIQISLPWIPAGFAMMMMYADSYETLSNGDNEQDSGGDPCQKGCSPPRTLVWGNSPSQEEQQDQSVGRMNQRVLMEFDSLLSGWTIIPPFTLYSPMNYQSRWDSYFDMTGTNFHNWSLYSRL